ncbi:MAG: patatin-like phospholipase family protein [Gemmatimonadota bacterium]
MRRACPRPPGSRAVALFALAVFVTGCAAIHRPPATVSSLLHDGTEAAEQERATSDTIVDRLARRALARGDRTLDLLLLSGGGQNGAYGAGFLRGWKTRADTVMPSFDLVTGISTGALQSPFAFVGSAASIDTLSALYRRSAERFVPTLDWFFWLRKTGGLVNTRRFRETLATVIDSAMRARLQVGFREGRQLVIGTTDMDLAVGHTWDLSREIASPDGGLSRVRQLLLTTSSIPGIFPPQVVDGRVHADGGVISNVLPVLSLAQYERLARQVRALGFKEPVTVHVWVIMNLWTQAPVAVMNPANRKRIAQRSNQLLFWAQQPQMLQRLQELTQAVNAGIDGVRMEMHYTEIPAAVAGEPGASALASHDFMLRLEQLGYDRARSATPWFTLPPSPYERPR